MDQLAHLGSVICEFASRNTVHAEIVENSLVKIHEFLRAPSETLNPMQIEEMKKPPHQVRQSPTGQVHGYQAMIQQPYPSAYTQSLIGPGQGHPMSMSNIPFMYTGQQ